MLHLYDTRTRTAQDISPMDGKTLRFYCCGPTVYGPAHIGNFRTFVMQDVFRRVLELGGVPTTHIRNLTDVDDKTIRDSQKAGVSLAEFTAGWADLFHRDCAALNCLPPHAEPSAVGHIPEQIRMVQTLVEKGHAYVSEDGSVYFRISSFPEYGTIDGQGGNKTFQFVQMAVPFRKNNQHTCSLMFCALNLNSAFMQPDQFVY